MTAVVPGAVVVTGRFGAVPATLEPELPGSHARAMGHRPFRSVPAGGVAVGGPAGAGPVVGDAAATGAAVRPVLSDREVEVLVAWLVADSKDGAAATLFISGSTVSTHISRIRAKYAEAGRPAPTKAHLLARALQDGYTSLADW